MRRFLLGAFLLAELLAKTEATIYCLVRGTDDAAARRRLLTTVRELVPLSEAAAARLVAVRGDLARPKLGIDASVYEGLVERIDTIVHSGAWVNFVFPYEILKPANVDGTTEVLRFATRGRRKAVHYLSSVAVLLGGGYDRAVARPEQALLPSDGDLPNGYEQSKWVADKNVELARLRGLPVSSYRVGYVTGASTDGRHFRTDEFFASMLKGCIQLGRVPRLATTMTMVPLDYVVHAVVAIILQPQTLGRVYHINHPRPVTFQAVADWIRTQGYPLIEESFDAWRERIVTMPVVDLRQNALYPYLDFIASLKEDHVILPNIQTTETQAATAGIPCPSTEDLLTTYFSRFVAEGFLERVRLQT